MHSKRKAAPRRDHMTGWGKKFVHDRSPEGQGGVE